MKKAMLVALAGATSLCATVSVLAQDPQEAGAPSPEALARMQPGPMHAKLEPLIGSFSMSGKWRMTPDTPWEEFEATVEREWLFDERYVKEEVSSEFMGQPFEGLGIIGYDNVREEYTLVWVDSMSTGTWYSSGQMKGSTLTFEGEHSDPMSGAKDAWAKSVLELGQDRQVYRGYAKDENGEEFQSAEMIATRE